MNYKFFIPIFFGIILIAPSATASYSQELTPLQQEELQLVEENLINLQEPITEFLPEFIDLKVISKEDGEIDNVEKINHYPTIEDLLLHTAGFSYNFLADPVGKEYDKLKLFKYKYPGN